MKGSPRFSVFWDTQFRFVSWTETGQYLARVGGDFKISRSFSFAPVGYAYVWNYQYGKQPVTFANNEHRIFQQFAFKHKTGGINVQHRLRTEERFIQLRKVDPNGDVTYAGYSNQQFRIRYRLFCSIPLTRQQDPSAMVIGPKSFYLVVFDEFFMSWGEAVTYNEIDQNRLFVGLGYQFTKDFTIQSGFFYQLIVKANGAQQENNIGLGIWLSYDIDLSRP